MAGIFIRSKHTPDPAAEPADNHKTVGKVILLDVNEIAPNPAQPRQEFDLEALAALADSIRMNGVLQPILVRRSRSSKAEKPFELISGERRLRASKLCGKETIPAVVMDSTSRQSAVYAILENIQRKDLNIFEEAAALKTLIVEWGVTQEEAAAKLGMAQSTIANKMRLLGLSETEQRLILENSLSERHGRALLRLLPGEEREAVAAVIAERQLTVRETEAAVERLRFGEPIESVFAPPDPPTVKDTPLQLHVSQPSAPPPDRPKKKSRRGRVMLVKDVRIFLNTVNQAIDAMKHAGIPAETRREDHEEYIEYRVRIPTTPAGRTSSAKPKPARNS